MNGNSIIPFFFSLKDYKKVVKVKKKTNENSNTHKLSRKKTKRIIILSSRTIKKD